MKKEFAIVLGLALLIALMPYASATTSVEGPEISVDPDSIFSYSNYQSGTGSVDIIVAQEGPAPVMPTLAEITFTAVGRGDHTINLSSVINGEEDDVGSLTIEVTVPWDVNNDGVINGEEDDVGSLTIEVTVPWDVNNDGVVNFLDLVEVITHWGESDTVYDVDRNGEVGYSDLSIVVEHLA
jgi:hypothetical protein